MYCGAQLGEELEAVAKGDREEGEEAGCSDHTETLAGLHRQEGDHL